MPPPRRAQKKRKQARRGPLFSIAEESAPSSREESGAATREESPPTSREERLARRLALQQDFTANPGPSTVVHEFQRALSSTKSVMETFEADLPKLRRIQSGRATTPPSPMPDTATPFPLVPIPIPPPSVVQQIERGAVSGGWIPYCSDPPSGVSLHYIDDAGKPVAQARPTAKRARRGG